jgi:hypothetical protein
MNNLQGIAHYYRRTIIIINTHPTQRMTSFIFRNGGYDFTASLHNQKKDMSLYHFPLTI